MKTISNHRISITVNEHGAELSSIKREGKEYLWQADPAFWGRHSPVLFPIVGSVWNGEYRVDSKTYHLGQHGFARDNDFVLIEESESHVRYRLTSEDMKGKTDFPYPFVLEITYRIHENNIDVIWDVKNPSDKEIHFQIGAHPAFYFPDYPENLGYLGFDRSEVDYIRIGEKGCADTLQRYPMPLKNGLLPIDTHTFDIDTFIIDNGQVKKVTLYDSAQKPALSLSFEAPLVGIWSPPGKNAPFICIEPWYGRCDRVGFTGEFKDRDQMNHLAPGAVFHAVYTITIQ